MSSGPVVVVNKGGFFSALAKGLFGTVMVVVVCATALGVYGLHIAGSLIGVPTEAVARLPELIAGLPEWRTMPPVVADTLNLRRDFAYGKSLTVATTMRLVREGSDEQAGVAEIEVTNHGGDVVSLLSLRVLIEDEGAAHIDRTVVAATPLAVGDWCGPLQPGATRRMPQSVFHIVGEPRVTVEVSDVWVWKGPADEPAALPPLPAAELPEPPPGPGHVTAQ